MNESKCTHYDPDYTGLCIECGHDLDYTTQSTTATPYQPRGGEWCEALDCGEWIKVKYVFIEEDGTHMVLNLDNLAGFYTSEIRPIKTEREQFIEQAAKVLQKNHQDVTGLCNRGVEMFNSAAKALFEAGFKAPE